MVRRPPAGPQRGQVRDLEVFDEQHRGVLLDAGGGGERGREVPLMNKAFVREPDQNAEYCPRCGSPGQPVGRETIQSYLSAEKIKMVADPANFCPSPQCDAVYFDAFERVVLTGDLDRPVYSKDSKENEVMDWVIPHGKGRVYVTMLGHLWKNGPDRA